MRVAALDLGTNTFLLLVAEVVSGKITRVLHDEARVVRLGQDVNKTRQFHKDALLRAEACFQDYQKTFQRLGVEKVLACATSAARDVNNRDQLVSLGAKYSIPVEIISGEREAEFTYWGTLYEGDLPSGKAKVPVSANGESDTVVIVDVGGGSTEFILGDRTGLVARKSLDIGAVRLTEMFVTEHPLPVNEIMKMTKYIQDKLLGLKEIFPIEPVSRFIAVAGTPTTLAALELKAPFDAARIQGYALTLPKIRQWTQQLAQMTIEERQRLPGMEPKRADVLVAGSLILMLSCQCFGVKGVEVSVRGLRYGVALSLSPSLSKLESTNSKVSQPTGSVAGPSEQDEM